MEAYIFHLGLKGYEIKDKDEGVVTKNGFIYKIFHNEESWYLVMEKKDFSAYCREKVKERKLRLFNQFELITSDELSEFTKLLENTHMFFLDEYNEFLFDDFDEPDKNVDLAYTEVDDEEFGHYEVQSSIDLINKRFMQKVISDKCPTFYSKYITYSSYKEMNESIDFDFDTLVRVDEEDWVGEVVIYD